MQESLAQQAENIVLYKVEEDVEEEQNIIYCIKKDNYFIRLNRKI